MTYCSINASFFFSSRRRHTRLQGHWSSDVCSSDLGQHVYTVDLKEPKAIERSSQAVRSCPLGTRNAEPLRCKCDPSRFFRSEERRVGRESIRLSWTDQ